MIQISVTCSEQKKDICQIISVGDFAELQLRMSSQKTPFNPNCCTTHKCSLVDKALNFNHQNCAELLIGHENFNADLLYGKEQESIMHIIVKHNATPLFEELLTRIGKMKQQALFGCINRANQTPSQLCSQLIENCLIRGDNIDKFMPMLHIFITKDTSDLYIHPSNALFTRKVMDMYGAYRVKQFIYQYIGGMLISVFIISYIFVGNSYFK